MSDDAPYETTLWLPWPTGSPFTDEEARTLIGQVVPVSLEDDPAGSMLILEARPQLSERNGQLLEVDVRITGRAAWMLRKINAGVASAALSAVVRPG